MKCTYCNSEWQTTNEVEICPFCGKSLSAELPVFSDIAQALRFTLDTYQAQINKNPNTILAYLSDLAPKLTNERRLLKMCADAGILAELLTVKDEGEKNLAAKRATAKLRDVYFLDAKWAETAVGWITAVDFADRGAAASQTQQERIQKRHEELEKYAGRIVCNDEHILALRSDGMVIAYGRWQHYVRNWRDVTAITCSGVLGIKGLGLTDKRTVLCQDFYCSDWKNIVQIVAWGSIPVGLCADGTVVARKTGTRYKGFVDWRNVTAIASNVDTLYGLLADGTVAACGNNEFMQCDTRYWKNVVSIAAGSGTIYGIRKDGRVYARGKDDCGQCDVDSWQDIIDIVPGDKSVFGLKSDGSVVHAGENDMRSESVRAWTDVVSLAQGRYSVAGLKEDGTVVACSHYGNSYDTSGWRDIVAIVCGKDYVVGLQADGTIVFTGKDNYCENKIAGQNLFR